MDCDTTGIEPDFALVKFKKLAGGGYFKIINQSLPVAFARLGYTQTQVDDIVAYCVGRKTLAARRTSTTRRSLRAKGFDQEGLDRIEAALAGAFDIQFAFNEWTLGAGYVSRQLGLNEAQLAEWNGNLLRALGFTAAEIEAANDYSSGTRPSRVRRTSAPSTWSCSTAPTAAARRASASSRSTRTSP